MISLPLIMLIGAEYGWRTAFCLFLFPVADFFFKSGELMNIFGIIFKTENYRGSQENFF